MFVAKTASSVRLATPFLNTDTIFVRIAAICHSCRPITRTRHAHLLHFFTFAGCIVALGRKATQKRSLFEYKMTVYRPSMIIICRKLDLNLICFDTTQNPGFVVSTSNVTLSVKLHSAFKKSVCLKNLHMIKQDLITDSNT